MTIMTWSQWQWTMHGPHLIKLVTKHFYRLFCTHKCPYFCVTLCAGSTCCCILSSHRHIYLYTGADLIYRTSIISPPLLFIIRSQFTYFSRDIPIRGCGLFDENQRLKTLYFSLFHIASCTFAWQNTDL